MDLCIRKFTFVFIFSLTVVCSGFAQVTFVIDRLPHNTPLQDTIYITGSFNGWKLEDSAYVLSRRLDGKYTITLPKSKGTIEYKFNRGGWSKWETDAFNNHKPNRKFTFGNGDTVYVTIENWQDVGGARPVDLFVFYFFGVGILSLVAILLLLRIKNPKKKEVRLLIIFTDFVAIAVFGRVLYEISSLEWLLGVELAGDVALFLSGPLWYFALNPSEANKSSWRLHTVPVAIITLLVFVKYFNVSSLEFLTHPFVNRVFNWDRLLFFGGALFSNMAYYLSARKKIKSAGEKLMPMELQFSKHMLLSGELFLSVLVLRAFLLMGGNENLLTWYNSDFQFLAISVFAWLIAYYALKHEDAFRFFPVSVKTEEMEALKSRVHEVMKNQKSFKDPHLTLNQLSEIVNVKPHLLSKIINECYQQNFRDFVNKYRVEEFVELAKHDNNKKYTFLALANEVGFNSKSTFNVAFKKVFQQSPREFFKANKMLEHFKKDQESLVL